jgi:hypothetical protein
MDAVQSLITALNSLDYRVFPQKGDAKKTTQSFLNPVDGKRYFITRVATNQIGANGQPVYIWATGKPMRELQTA